MRDTDSSKLTLNCKQAGDKIRAVGPDLGSSLLASRTIIVQNILSENCHFKMDAADFFKAATLYPRIQWVKYVMHLNYIFNSLHGK